MPALAGTTRQARAAHSASPARPCRDFPGGSGGGFVDGAGFTKTSRQRASDLLFADAELNRCVAGPAAAVCWQRKGGGHERGGAGRRAGVARAGCAWHRSTGVPGGRHSGAALRPTRAWRWLACAPRRRRCGRTVAWLEHLAGQELDSKHQAPLAGSDGVWADTRRRLDAAAAARGFVGRDAGGWGGEGRGGEGRADRGPARGRERGGEGEARTCSASPQPNQPSNGHSMPPVLPCPVPACWLPMPWAAAAPLPPANLSSHHSPPPSPHTHCSGSGD